jgi:hydrogenase maturation factor
VRYEKAKIVNLLKATVPTQITLLTRNNKICCIKKKKKKVGTRILCEQTNTIGRILHIHIGLAVERSCDMSTSPLAASYPKSNGGVAPACKEAITEAKHSVHMNTEGNIFHILYRTFNGIVFRQRGNFNFIYEHSNTRNDLISSVNPSLF